MIFIFGPSKMDMENNTRPGYEHGGSNPIGRSLEHRGGFSRACRHRPRYSIYHPSFPVSITANPFFPFRSDSIDFCAVPRSTICESEIWVEFLPNLIKFGSFKTHVLTLRIIFIAKTKERAHS
jgi:hypothetical protein